MATNLPALLLYLYCSHYAIDALNERSPSPIVSIDDCGVYRCSGGPSESLKVTVPLRFYYLIGSFSKTNFPLFLLGFFGLSY